MAYYSILADGRYFIDAADTTSTTDLSVKMKEAIDVMPATGGCLFLSAGTHWVESELNPEGQDRVTVQGLGLSSVVKFDAAWAANSAATANQRWIGNTDPATDHQGWQFCEFVFDGNADALSLPEGECFRDKIIKLRGDNFTCRDLLVRNEAGRGFATILGDNQYWLNIRFKNIGTDATDSSLIHPGNQTQQSSFVVIDGCMCDLEGNDKTTFIDAVMTRNMVVTNNICIGGKTGLILSWDEDDENVEPGNFVIGQNVFVTIEGTNRAARVAEKNRRNNSNPNAPMCDNVVLADNVFSGKNKVLNPSLDPNSKGWYEWGAPADRVLVDNIDIDDTP